MQLSPELRSIQLNYLNSGMDITNNGHWIELSYKNGSFLIFQKVKYNLLSFQFHTPSEHLIDGKRADIEIEFIHQNDKGKILILSILVQKGKMNFPLQEILMNTPKVKNTTNFLEVKKTNPLNFFPEDGGYYTYEGSLTSPPCPQNVTWIVLKTPIQASLNQIKKLTQLYPFNSRPTQPLNNRKVRLKE